MPSSKCSNEMWVKTVILEAIESWLHEAHKLPDDEKVNESKKFPAIKVNHTDFDHLCERLPVLMKPEFDDKNCKAFQQVPVGVWRQKHRDKEVSKFVEDLADEILNGTLTS